MDKMSTTLTVKIQTRDLLKDLGRKDESYDYIIRQLIARRYKEEEVDCVSFPQPAQSTITEGVNK